MTTFTTTQAIPHRRITQSWRFVATFAAGIALASGVAVGIHAQDNSTATRLPQPSVQLTPATAADAGCRVRVPGPC